ncbi:gustatory receptor 28b-like protein [Lasius niger]|uniref:Gustatory receptor 28b-like protein n=1 Tax=Lasius niger TaxID=67767 RepID=A0A0J7JXA6_LASNI|nr:gustatory receptor 28b-like protein [Lasius niger]
MLASNYISIPFRLNLEYEYETKLTKWIDIVQSIFGTVVICTILFFYCVDQKSLVRIMNRLTDIEHEIDSLYNPMRRQRVSSNLIIVCILNTCLLIVLVTTELLIDANPVSWLSDILPTFHVGWLIMQYFMLVTIIQADFADVNRALQNLSRVSTPDLRPQTLCQTRRVIVTNSTVHQLLKLRDVHCHLCEISGTVSDFYSLPILFGVAFFFLTLVYDGYFVLLPLLMSNEEYKTYGFFAIDVIWFIYMIYPLALLNNRITKILNEVD